MSGKSQCKKLLLELCTAIAKEHGEDPCVQFDCVKEFPAEVTCCDGLVLLNRIGAVMSRSTAIGAFSDDGYEIPRETARSFQEEMMLERENDAPFDADFLADLAGTSDEKKTYGTWYHMYSAFAREVDNMFARSESTVVVLGFDKRSHVDGVKALTHEKRFDLRLLLMTTFVKMHSSPTPFPKCYTERGIAPPLSDFCATCLSNDTSHPKITNLYC